MLTAGLANGFNASSTLDSTDKALREGLVLVLQQMSPLYDLPDYTRIPTAAAVVTMDTDKPPLQSTVGKLLGDSLRVNSFRRSSEISSGGVFLVFWSSLAPRRTRLDVSHACRHVILLHLIFLCVSLVVFLILSSRTILCSL